MLELGKYRPQRQFGRGGFLMQAAFISFAVLFVLACIVFVIGHLSGLSGFDPARYQVLRGVLPVAYVVVVLAAGTIAASIAASIFKK